MIQDDDDIVMSKTDRLVDQIILDAFNHSYVNRNSDDKYFEVTGLFRVIFSEPILVVPPGGDHYYINDHVISVKFYKYEYEEMIKDTEEQLVCVGVRDDGSVIKEERLVWKTKNNLALKLREFGANVQWMDSVEYGLKAIYDDTGQ